MGAERKRPGPEPYSNDTASAYVKMAVHPGDDLDIVIAAGREALQRALNDAPSRNVVAPRAHGWIVRAEGFRPADPAPRSLGLRYVDGAHVGEFALEDSARKAEKGLALLDRAGAKVSVTPPTGGA